MSENKFGLPSAKKPGKIGGLSEKHKAKHESKHEKVSDSSKKFFGNKEKAMKDQDWKPDDSESSSVVSENLSSELVMPTGQKRKKTNRNKPSTMPRPVPDHNSEINGM